MKSSRMVIAAAALSGLIAGSAANAAALGSVTTHGRTMQKLTQQGNSGVKALSADDKAKHDCKGKNGCKGEGGCKTGDNGCKGKNSCKGKGGCKTNDTGKDKSAQNQ